MSTAAPVTPEPEPCLPALRQELRILPGETLPSGAPSWLLFDPVRNAYHRLERDAYERLSAWRAEPTSRYLMRINNIKNTPTTQDELKDFTTFLYSQKLVLYAPGGDSEAFAAQEFAANPPLSHTLIHKYLFFRIPLVQPDRFLRASYPFIAWIFSRAFMFFVLSCGLLGLYFTGRQWDDFTQTFLHFLTFEGLVYYGLTLAGLKIIHELGHAFTAHHFKSRVPVMGLAFLVMFPILYTDTTNAWELTDLRKRVLIDAAGMVAELMMACIALLLWSFLPDGALRSAAFFTATTSWLLSLMVNLNPMMRFDGYYLLADLFGIPNMQADGFAAGRWHMRESLFGLGELAPSGMGSKRRRALIIYAYATWVYRFFLFIGIALLVHALFPKAIGIILFTVEIGWFIALPIYKELKTWWSLRMTILNSHRGRLTCALFMLAMAAFIVPWQRSISAPALLRPALQTELFPMSSAKIIHIPVINGQAVQKGQIIAVMDSDNIDIDIESAQHTLALINAQLARRGADRQDLTSSSLLVQSKQREQERLSGLADLRQALTLRAPHDGIISDMPTDLHQGRYVTRDFRIARLIAAGQQELIAFPKESQAARLTARKSAIFIPDDISRPRVKAVVSRLAPTSLPALTEATLSSFYRGPIAVSENEHGQSIPHSAIFQVRAIAHPQEVDEPSSLNLREYRGVLKMSAEPQSPLQSLLKSVSRVLIREADF